MPLLVMACAAPARPGPPPAVVVESRELVLEDEGIRLEQAQWRWADQRGRVWLATVRLPGRVRVEPSAGVVEFDRLLPTDPGPWAAINGGFYEDGAPMGLVVVDGRSVAPLRPRGGSGVFEVTAAGRPRVVHRDAWRPGARFALQSVDRIVEGGRALTRRRDDGPRSARSAVALGRGRVTLVVAAAHASTARTRDGVRLGSTGGRGLALGAFAELLIEHVGAVQALNLDGGISAQMAVRAGGRTFRVASDFGTINALVVRP